MTKKKTKLNQSKHKRREKRAWETQDNQKAQGSMLKMVGINPNIFITIMNIKD